MAATATVGDRFSLVYPGTMVTAGQGAGVVATGQGTELGRLSEMLPEVQTLTSQLLRKIVVFARGLSVSLILVAGTFGLFAWTRAQGMEIEGARTEAVNTLVVFEAFYLLNSRYLHTSVWNRKGLFGNRYVLRAIGLVVLLQLLFTYALPMQTLFGTAAIEAATWGLIFLVASSVFFLVELEKLFYGAWQRRGRAAATRRDQQ